MLDVQKPTKEYISPDAKFNQILWWLLQEIRGEQLLSPDGKNVEFHFKGDIRKVDDGSMPPSYMVQEKLFYKLKSLGVLDLNKEIRRASMYIVSTRDRRFDSFLDETGPDIPSKEEQDARGSLYGFHLTICQEKFDELYRSLETHFSKKPKENLKELSQAEMVTETGEEGIGGKNVSIGDIHNSKVIIQIADKAKQEAAIGKDRYEELKEVLQSLKESIDKLGLEFQRKTELQEQIKEIDRDMSSSKPNDKFR